jgi:hypothetical protein
MSDFVFDGESVSDVLYALDPLEWAGEDYRPKPYEQRLVTSASVLKLGGSG